MRNLFILSALCLLGKLSAQNQSYDFYSHRLGNFYNINPAHAGKDEKINVFINAQSQNKGVAYANRNFAAGAYSRISEKQGLGGKIISDTRGAFQTLKADLSYAYIAELGEENTLIFGLNAGIQNTNFNINRIENHDYIDISDPTILSNTFNTTQFTTGVGLLYEYKTLEVSVSMPNIINTAEPLNSYLFGAVFYTIETGSPLTITPWVSYQQVPVTKNVISVYTRATYDNKLWLQAGYQSGNSFLASIGTNIDQMGFAYGYRMNNKAFSNVSSGTHEVMINLNLNKRKKSTSSNSSKKIATIRF
jgi:type IX secretion system PorP/SprF family membrane protein